MQIPSIEQWLREAKNGAEAPRCGMYLVHNGTVRADARDMVRSGAEGTLPVKSMRFSYNADRVEEAKKKALEMPGIHCVRVWLNEGELSVGDDIMYVLVGGDIRPHVVDALQSLVDELKGNCVTEEEIYE